MFDVLVLHGLIVDGSGGESRVADVGIGNGRIEAIGPLEGSPAACTIEARGLVVAPGFIDIHNHSDLSLLVDPRALSSLRQGVTTLAIGNCGFGCAPVVDRELIKWNIVGYRSSWGVNIDWQGFDEYLDRLRASSLSLNVLPLVSHGALRLAVTGLKDRRASQEEVRAMRVLLRECLEDGARGLSTGLEYSPGSAADLNELRALASEVEGGVYATHVRSRAPQFLLDSVDEAIATVEGSNVRLQISHLAPRAEMPPQLFDAVLARVAEAHERGIDVGFDTLVYEWGPHLLADMLPWWIRRGSLDEVVEKLRMREVRKGIKESERSSVQQLLSTGRARSVTLSYAPNSHAWQGMTLAEIGEATGKDPFDVAVEILLAEETDFLAVALRTPYTSDAFIDRLLAEPGCVPMSDGMAVSADGPLKGFDVCRGSYGWVARFIDKYVRCQGVLNLEEAVRRLTALPAKYLGLRDRGLLQVGQAADVTVLDPQRVRDRSGEWGPPSYAEGVQYVLVNGRVAVDNGVETGVRPGRIL